ncbi:MAG: hypothetical protein QXZ09_08285 [Candidatus Methanomethylicaceae archaeon]
MDLILITEAELRKILKQLGWSGTRLSKRAWSMLIRYYAKQGYNVFILLKQRGGTKWAAMAVGRSKRGTVVVREGTFVPRRSCLRLLNNGPRLGRPSYKKLSMNARKSLRSRFKGEGYKKVLTVRRRDSSGPIVGLALIQDQEDEPFRAESISLPFRDQNPTDKGIAAWNSKQP